MDVMDLYKQICKERQELIQRGVLVAGEDSAEPAKKVNKKKEKPSLSNKSLTKKRDVDVDSVKPPFKKQKLAKIEKCTTPQNVTDDGFKIVSELDLLSDDSDISDAFESDADDVDIKMKEVKSKSKSANPSTKASVDGKFTDDGFRIVSSIPDDDSDISDAFDTDESDLEDDNNAVPVVSNNSKTNKKNNLKAVVGSQTTNEENTVDGSTSEENTITKKRKRGARNKKGTIPVNANPIAAPKAMPSLKQKDKDKKNGKSKKRNSTQLTEEDIEAIKAKIPPKVQKVIMEFGLDWAKFDTPAEKEKRELAKLPQPEQIANCTTYLKKDPVSGKIITVYDYSKKRGGPKAECAPSKGAAKTVAGATNPSTSGMKQSGVVTATPTTVKAIKKAGPSDEPLTKEQLELIELKKKMKAEHLEELRNIKRNIVNNVINKSLDPRTKDQKRLALIQKLGGVVKKPYVNYKVLMENKKKEKVEAEAARENLKNIGMHDLLKKKRRRFRKKDANEVAGFNSLGGRIRDGVMVIGKKDIAKMNG